VTWTSNQSIAHASIQLSILARGDRRLEAETYLMSGYQIRQQVENGALPTSTAGKLARIWQPPRLAGIQVEQQDGVPFLTATQVFDIRPKARKWLAPGRTPDLRERFVEPGWILVTCSGIVGDATISHAPHRGVIISHDLLRVQPSQEEDRGYLYCFFRSRYGRPMMQSSKYGNLIKHLEPEHVEELPVPLVDANIKHQLQKGVDRVFSLRDQAFSLVEEADRKYVEGLGLKAPPFGHQNAYKVAASELFEEGRRLDGFYYNPDAQIADHALKECGYPVIRLLSATQEIFGTARFKHVYATKGIPYVDSEDLFKVNPQLEKFIPPQAKKNAEGYFVKRDWLLMAVSGQIYGINGSVVLADLNLENKVISNHVVRIVPKPDGMLPGYLQVALSHPTFGRPLAVRLAFGTEVPEIAPEDIARIPVVKPPKALEEELAGLIDKARALRSEADALENQTVGWLEELLEPDLGPSAGLGGLSQSHDAE